MHLSMTNFLRFRAATDEGDLPISDAFVDLASHRLGYVAIDTGTWRETTETLVAADLVSGHDPEARRCRVDLSTGSLAKAPALSSSPRYRALMPLETWPPLLVGPFGTTQSPLLLETQARAETGDEGAETNGAPAGHADRLVARLERASRLIGMDAFGTDGPLGTLADAIFDADTGQIELYALLPTDGRREKACPTARMRHVAGDDTHAVLALDRATLDALPDMAEADEIDSAWIQSVLS